MPYIGCHLSENYYKIVGRRGVKTNKTRSDVVKWMGELTDKVRGFPTGGNSLTVYVKGKFYDGRVPDIDNLAKVILDAIKVGVGLDDRYIKFVSLGYEIDWSRPVLEITLANEGETLS